jgi:hypothetical protein
MVEFIKQEANEKAHEILIKVSSLSGPLQWHPIECLRERRETYLVAQS